jgi:hypothetical protein
MIMLFEEAQMLGLLRQIVARCTHDPELQRDLMQESLLHLWKLEQKEPGRTRSWYLQGCRFHLQHFLVSGRSLDSLKRASADNRIAIDGDDEDPTLHGHRTNGGVFEAVSFADVVSTLKREITPRGRQVLSGLANGMVLQEIAFEFGISYPTVLKYRRKLATVATRLGIAQPFSGLKQSGVSASKSDAITKGAAGRARRRPSPASSKKPSCGR